ncbi:MAG: DUF4240 domain-containing protein [Oscillibacter sp.]|nr:DUF4240 domain-containing protein [Oscillibacter sp.]
MKELKLYSPLQVDIIDRDNPGHVIPLQAVNHEQEPQYLGQIVNVLQGLQSQEDARNAFTAPNQDWSEICEKICSCTRSIELINGRLYGVYSCRSSGELDADEVDALKWYCQDRWEHDGWGEGYAHCPRESPSLGLYIHYWQDDGAPLLTREQLETVRRVEQSRPTVTEVTPDTFWTLIEQAKDVYGQELGASAYWLTEQLLATGPEQALNFHSIMHGYMELADKYGLWNAANLIQNEILYRDGFEDFRTWLIAQGKDIYFAALKDPDSLADISDCEDCLCEDLLYVGDMAHERLTGRMIDDDTDSAAHQQLIAELRQGIVYGAEIGYPHEWSELAAYLPRLTAQRFTPEKLRACARRVRLWNHDDPDIQKARSAAPKKKKSRQNKGGDAR